MSSPPNLSIPGADSNEKKPPSESTSSTTAASNFSTFFQTAAPSLQRRARTSPAPVPTPAPFQPSMLTRRTSWSATTQNIERRFRRPFGSIRDRFRSGPLDPSVPIKEETYRGPAREEVCSVNDLLASDLPRSADSSGSGLNFPEFESLEPYCVADYKEIQEKLWKQETARLHRAATDPEFVLRYQNRDFFDIGDEDGYRKLSKLAEKILTAMAICSLDNECINVRFCKEISNRARLQKWIQQAQVAGASGSQDDELEGLLSLDDSNKRKKEHIALFDLLNYITAVLARLIARSNEGKFWQRTVLRALVRRTTKIKLLLLDLSANAQVAAQNGELVLDLSRERGPDEQLNDEEEECEEALRIIDANAKDGLTSVEEAEVAAYCVTQNKYRSGMNAALKGIVMGLRNYNRSGFGATTYEICGLVYETGFHGFKTLLHQSRDMEYSATSDLVNLNTADSAFGILHEIIESLGAAQRSSSSPPTDADTKSDYQTFIEWNYKIHSPTQPQGPCSLPRSSQLGQLNLSSMDSIITIMVPLSTTNPTLISELTSFLSTLLLSEDNPDPIHHHQETDFTAYFRLYTSSIEASTRNQGALSLSNAYKKGVFNRCALIESSNSLKELATPSDILNPKTIEKFTEYTQIMDTEWMMSEDSITVNCKFYVLSLAFVAFVLAGGGVAIGFTVGDAIQSVDPFNIATYTWVLAAFVILICKAILVEEWSWSDFLHGRVRCRSISELEAVTGIRDQLIIAKLLHDESGGGILTTKGPYNSIFLRRSEEFGFSIDRPIETTTMLISGLTPLKVITPRGEALACLDARRGTHLRAVEHSAKPGAKYLVCTDLDRRLKMAGTTDRAKRTRLQLALSKELKWKRVVGVYKADGVVFV